MSSSGDSSAGEEDYEVEQILKHKKTPGGYKYFVRWKGYGPEDDCWTQADGFSAPELEAAYWASKSRRSSTPRSAARSSVESTSAKTKTRSVRREISQPTTSKRNSARRVRTYKESSSNDDYSSGSDMRAGSDSPPPKMIRKKYRGADPMNSSFEEQEEDEDEGEDNKKDTKQHNSEYGSRMFSTLGSPPASEMDARDCFERPVVTKFSPPYEMTPEPGVPVSTQNNAQRFQSDAVKPEPSFKDWLDQNADLQQEQPVNNDERIVEIVATQSNEKSTVNTNMKTDEESDDEWENLSHRLPRPPSPQGKTSVNDGCKDMLVDVFDSPLPNDPYNALIQALPKASKDDKTEHFKSRRVQIRVLEDVWQDDFWVGMEPNDISQAYNEHLNKLIEEQYFLEDYSERSRLEYIYQKRYIEKLVLSWKLLQVNHIDMGKIPTKILAVVSETFTNDETKKTLHKYYGVIGFWKCPGVAQQLLWSDLCERCPKIVNQFRLDYLEHKKMMNGFNAIVNHVNDVNIFWMNENRKFGHQCGI